MKKTLTAMLAFAAVVFLSTAALAGYPLKVSASPYNGQIDAAQPVSEGSSAVVTDQWNVPVEHKIDVQSGAKGAADASQRPYYRSMEVDTDHWNVPRDFAE